MANDWIDDLFQQMIRSQKNIETANSIDEFIKSLGVQLEEPNGQDEYKVRVMFSKLEDKYYLHCFILGEIARDDLPGKLLRGQKTFYRTTLHYICEKIEEGLDEYGVAFHRDPPESFHLSPGHVKVSYEISYPKKLKNDLLTDVGTILTVLYNREMGNQNHW